MPCHKQLTFVGSLISAANFPQGRWRTPLYLTPPPAFTERPLPMLPRPELPPATLLLTPELFPFRCRGTGMDNLDFAAESCSLCMEVDASVAAPDAGSDACSQHRSSDFNKARV